MLLWLKENYILISDCSQFLFVDGIFSVVILFESDSYLHMKVFLSQTHIPGLNMGILSDLHWINGFRVV